MRTRARRLAIILMAFAVTFTSLPVATGDFNVHAATAKKPAKVTGVKKSSATASTITIKWTKIKKNKNTKGYAIYRNGRSVGKVNKAKNTFTDRNLKSGTSYKYQVRAYNTYKVKQWYNKKTKKWQTKKPKKKFRGKSRKVTKYKLGTASAVATIKTSTPVTSPNPSPSPNPGVDDSGTTTSSTRTKVTGCVDYYNASQPDMWKDAGGTYWTAEKGGTKIEEPWLKDKRIEKRWTSGTTGTPWMQKNSITVYVATKRNSKNGNVSLCAYNGDANRAKLVIKETTRKFYGWDSKTRQFTNDFDRTYVMSGTNRIAMFEETVAASAGGNLVYCPGIWFEMNNNFGFDGFVGGTIHIDAYYDFNGDGKHASDEFVGTVTVTTKAKPLIEWEYNVAKAAVTYYNGYGTSSYKKNYDKDMYAIRAYMYEHYDYFTKENNVAVCKCIGGANALRAWSVKEYGVYGDVYEYGTGGHEVFYPSQPNNYTDKAYFEAQGHGATGDNPGTNSYNTNLKRYKNFLN